MVGEPGEASGDELRRVRTARGWSQADLAQHLGVGQQAVSRWERGGGRPSPLLREQVQHLLEGLAVGSVAGRPLLPRLPFDQLSARDFERFAVDLVCAEHPSGSADVAHLWGGTGDAQDGVDALGSTPDGRGLAIQCKQVKRFGPEDVHRAARLVEERFRAPSGHPVDEFWLVLSRTASPGARTALAEHHGWKLRDADTLSSAVRALPPERAIRLVETFFPRLREDFLGVAQPSPWLKAAEFAPRGPLFVRLPSDGSQLGSGDSSGQSASLPFVGRKTELGQLTQALASPAAVVLLAGPGGAGKSRLLAELAEHLPNAQVRFVIRDQDVRPEDFELLPKASLVLVVDDADGRDDVEILIRGARHRGQRAKILLGVRPSGAAVVRRRAQSALGWTAQIAEVTIGELTAKEARGLVESASNGQIDDDLTHQLADAARDCPALLVAGAAAAARGQLALAPATGAVDLRQEVMTVFADVVDPATGVDAASVRQVLTAIAALQPLRWGRGAFLDVLAELAGLTGGPLEAAINLAEAHGLLLSRRNSYRVVPDLLGDALLAEACRPRLGAPSQFLRALSAVNDDEVLAHVLENCARLDWQHGLVETTSDTLWDALEEKYASADGLQRHSLVAAATRAAGHRPDRALNFVQLMLAEEVPAARDSDTQPWWSARRDWTDLDVLRAAPPLLRAAAHDIGLVPQTARLLWDLAMTDHRAVHQYPDHPVRVLRELAQVALGKPLIYNQAVIDVVTQWAQEPALRHRPQATCLDLLTPLLAVEGERTSFDGAVITVQRHSFDHQSVTGVRERTIRLALEHLPSADIRLAASAARLVDAALQRGRGGGDEPAWEAELLQTFSALASRVTETALDPSVAVLLRRTARHHRRFGDPQERTAAGRALDALPATLTDRLACEVQGLWSDWLDDATNWHAQQIEHEQGVHDLMRACLAAWGVRGTVEQFLHQARGSWLVVDPTSSTQSSGTPWYVASVLTEESPEAGEELLRRAIAAAARPNDSGELNLLVSLVPAVLGRLTDLAGVEAMTYARKLVAADTAWADYRPHFVGAAVAQALGGWRGPRDGFLPGEEQLLGDLLQHVDQAVVIAAVGALRVVAQYDPAKAASLLDLVDITANLEELRPSRPAPTGSGRGVLSEVLLLVGRQGPLDWDAVPSLRNRLTKALLLVPDLEDYMTAQAVCDLSADDPERVIELLLNRCERELAHLQPGYWALPDHPRLQLRVRDSAAFSALLQKVLDWTASDADSRALRGSDLFAAVAGVYDDEVIAVLQRFLQRGRGEDVAAVSAALRSMPRTVLWERVDVVEELLGLAMTLGEEPRHRVQRALRACAVGTSRHGVVGEPYEEDVERRDRSRSVLEHIGRGSPAWSLYSQLLDEAEETIAEEISGDSMLRDGRRW